MNPREGLEMLGDERVFAQVGSLVPLLSAALGLKKSLWSSENIICSLTEVPACCYSNGRHSAVDPYQ